MEPYSVGIPVRNEENTLEDAVDSVLNQTVSPENIFICVNGSKDLTLDIAHDLASQEKRIEVLESEPGKANAWNKIFHTATDNKMMFIDGDVMIDKNSAEFLLRHFKDHPSLSLIAGSRMYLKPKKTTFISDFVAGTYNEVYTGDFCSGGLYMLNKNNLFFAAQQQKRKLLPAEIIAEDLYLELIAKENDSFSYSSDAYFMLQPETTFSDYVMRRTRFKECRIQMKEYFPSTSLQKEITLPNILSYYKRIQSLPPKQQLRRVINVIFNRTVPYLGSFKNPQGILWSEPKSTKESFDEFS